MLAVSEVDAKNDVDASPECVALALLAGASDVEPNWDRALWTERVR